MIRCSILSQISWQSLIVIFRGKSIVTSISIDGPQRRAFKSLKLRAQSALYEFIISSINFKSFCGKDPSNRLFNVSFDIENPAFSMKSATRIAIIGSKICIPVIFISSNPAITPSDEYMSVLKCSPSAKREIEFDFFATLKSTLLTKKFATTAKSITMIPRVVSTSKVLYINNFLQAS